MTMIPTWKRLLVPLALCLACALGCATDEEFTNLRAVNSTPKPTLTPGETATATPKPGATTAPTPTISPTPYVVPSVGVNPTPPPGSVPSEEPTNPSIRD